MIENKYNPQNTNEAIKLAEVLYPEIKNYALSLNIPKNFDPIEKNMS